MNFLYGKIGKKLKGLAIASTAIGVIASVISGIAMISNSNVVFGILIIVVGTIFSWIMSWLIYGIGELNCKMDKILLGKSSDGPASSHKSKSGTTSQKNRKSAKKEQNNGKTKKIKQLDTLKKKGLISEEEYQNAINGQ